LKLDRHRMMRLYQLQEVGRVIGWTQLELNNLEEVEAASSTRYSAAHNLS
jgi:hypothetical protein